MILSARYDLLLFFLNLHKTLTSMFLSGIFFRSLAEHNFKRESNFICNPYYFDSLVRIYKILKIVSPRYANIISDDIQAMLKEHYKLEALFSKVFLLQEEEETVAHTGISRGII